MSGTGRSVLFLLQRCVAVSQRTLPAAIVKTAQSCGFTQNRTWTSATRTVWLRRFGELQAAGRSSQARFCTKAGEPSEEEYPPLPDYQSESKPTRTKDIYIIQVKGLPWTCTTHDLLHFFSDCRVHDGENGIHLAVDQLGRPSGRAFIELEHEEDVRKALEKHRQYLGPRYVEVFEVTNTDAEAILTKSAHPPADGVVKLRGLPFDCTEDEIVAFFSGLDIVENGITIVANRKGRRTGEGFVKFTSQEAANEALQRDRDLIGSRYIEVFPSSSEDIESTLRRRMGSAPVQTNPEPADWRPQNITRAAAPHSSTVPLHYIHMRGLPFPVSGEDIVKFFYPLAVSKILIECGPTGRPSGEADVFFRCHSDALTAMSKDKMNVGRRYIELFLNSVPNSDGH
ncbi:G-rich sequence factor 1 [Stegastes partitus]|uniref:G-rich RNA sequence binding factor 1 n=1 Tax=Stegastes partitus TaxID=144197 RepID=A0A3B5BII0_9TELE|nr:PREDICTED: G-rich sequence factor 1 [Stegastes partitus]XP_008298477.1 PREDICTED: G-rich sequence factor 1 [Stegastes partitus]XP_008298478.1 PREDICTED: G-rich sequence factor 1 [Stegastes partitus]